MLSLGVVANRRLRCLAAFMLIVCVPSVSLAELVTPVQLSREYKANELAADAKYKEKTVELLGVVEEIRRDTFGKIAVHFSVGEPIRHVRCTAPESQANAVAELMSGQLVKVRGIGQSKFMNNPFLKDCVVVWKGEKPDGKATKESKVAAKIAARSLELCISRPVMEAKDLDALAREIAHGKPVSKKDVDQLRQFKKLGDKAAADLKDLGAAPLSCEEPLLKAIWGCEDDNPDFGPECKSAQVKAAQAALQH